ncbi:ATP-dependent Lon protease pim1, partial [Cladochytrium tenue]
ASVTPSTPESISTFKLANGDEVVVVHEVSASSSPPAASAPSDGSSGSPGALGSSGSGDDEDNGDSRVPGTANRSQTQKSTKDGEKTSPEGQTKPDGETEAEALQRSSASAAAGPKPASNSTAGDQSAGDANRRSGDDPKSLQRIAIPKEYPQLLAIPLTRRPLFPGFYKSLHIRDPQVIGAIKALVDRRQPYLGVFLAKDDNSELDIVTSPDQVHPVGVFAQISNIYPSGPDNNALTVLLYPHRRIKMTDLVKPKS